MPGRKFRDSIRDPKVGKPLACTIPGDCRLLQTVQVLLCLIHKTDNRLKEADMYGTDRIYKKVEIIGVAAGSIEAAIETALVKAQSSLEKMSWFEVGDIRGHIGPNGTVAEYQVVIKVAFELKG